jgi:replicative superfamily II helicase
MVLSFNELQMLKTHMEDEEILFLLASSKEFDNIKLREEEMPELEKLSKKYCPVKIKGGLDSPTGKANVLLQTYISQGVLDASTLSSDCYYIQQSAGRITRALFEMVLKKGKTFLASRLLTFCKMIDRRIWEFQHPLRQFPYDITHSSPCLRN